MMGQAFTAEVKLDGERMLAHIGFMKDERVVHFYTRRANDYTDTYSAMGSHLKECMRYPGTQCILDGEILAWDDEVEAIMPFGDNRTVAKEEAEAGSTPLKRWLKYIIFDIVYLDGPGTAQIISNHVLSRDLAVAPTVPATSSPGDLTRLPLAIRRAILKDVLITKENRLDFF